MATAQRREKGEGSIFHRADGQWVGRITLDDGKRKTYYGKTKSEVKAKLKEGQKAKEEGTSLDADRLTLAQYLDQWLSASVKPSVKTKTYEGYESIVRVRVVPHIGSRTAPGQRSGAAHGQVKGRRVYGECWSRATGSASPSSAPQGSLSQKHGIGYCLPFVRLSSPYSVSEDT